MLTSYTSWRSSRPGHFLTFRCMWANYLTQGVKKKTSRSILLRSLMSPVDVICRPYLTFTFQQYGAVSEVIRPIDKSKNNEPKNFCFVTFEKERLTWSHIAIGQRCLVFPKNPCTKERKACQWNLYDFINLYTSGLRRNWLMRDTVPSRGTRWWSSRSG